MRAPHVRPVHSGAACTSPGTTLAGRVTHGPCGSAGARSRRGCIQNPRSLVRQPRACNSATVRQRRAPRSEEHTSELQSLMRISYAVFCLKKKKTKNHLEKKSVRKVQQ